MAKYTITVNFDDSKHDESLDALKLIEPTLEGESDEDYVQRLFIEMLEGKILEGKTRLALQAISSQIKETGVSK